MVKATNKKPPKQEVDNSTEIVRSYDPHITYLTDQKRMFSEASDYFVKETNETERALCAQLMLIDTVLLTGTLIAIANKDLLDVLTGPTKTLMAIALFFLLVSIAFGISYYFSIIKYNNRWAKAKHEAAMKTLDNNIQTFGELRKVTDAFQLDIPEENSQAPLKTQIVFTGISAILYLGAILGLVFNVGDIVNSINSFLASR